MMNLTLPPLMLWRSSAFSTVLMRECSLLGAMLLIVSGSLSCGQSQTMEREADRGRQEPEISRAAAEQTALEWYGRVLAQALTAEDMATVNALQDMSGMIDRLCPLVPPRTRSRYDRGPVTDPNPNIYVLRGTLAAVMGKLPGGFLWNVMGGEVTFVRVRQREEMPAVLLRVVTPLTIDYVEVMVRPGVHSFVAVDMYMHSLHSTTLQEAAVMRNNYGLDDIVRTLGMKPAPPEADPVLKLHAARREKKHAEVLRLYAELTTLQKEDRRFLLMWLEANLALQSSGEGEGIDPAQILRETAERFSGEGRIPNLVKIRLRYLEGDFEQAGICLKHLEGDIGGDPYLKYLRGRLRLRLGDGEGALALADEADREEPMLIGPAYLRIVVQMLRKDFKAVVDECRLFQKKFHSQPNEQFILSSTNGREFLASPEFAAWEKEIAAP